MSRPHLINREMRATIHGPQAFFQGVAAKWNILEPLPPSSFPSGGNTPQTDKRLGSPKPVELNIPVIVLFRSWWIPIYGDVPEATRQISGFLMRQRAYTPGLALAL